MKKKFLLLIATLVLTALVIKYSDWILDLIHLVFSIITPLLLGCAVAYILNIPVVWIEKLPCFRKEGTRLYKIRRPVSILGSIVVIAAIGILIILIVIPQLAQAIGVLFQEIPTAVTWLMNWMDSADIDWPQLTQFLDSLNVNWQDLFQKAMSYLTTGLGSIFSSTVNILNTITSGIVTLAVAVIFSIYILSAKEKLFAQFRTLMETYLKKRFQNGLTLVLKTAHNTFTKFIVGQCTEAVILGSLCTVGMFILRFPYASMIGTLVGATALLPVVGAYLGAGVGAFMILTVNPLRAVGFLVFIIILQQIEGNLIYPRVVGSSVGLPGIWVLAAVTMGGGIGGIAGMLLAVPVTATLYKLLGKDVKRRKEKVRADSKASNSKSS